ncbi:MAG: hypothetical protein ACKPKO_50405, partial [Candidatus Fonsibacter sp.]
MRNEVRCRRVLTMLQRGVPQALLGRLQVLECDDCGQGAPLPISQQLRVVGLCVLNRIRNGEYRSKMELLK